MTIHIADIELTAPREPMIMPVGATGLLALLRRNRRPVGILRLATTARRISVDELEAALALQPAAPESTPEPAESAHQPISIIVCTYQRPDDLARCLAALVPLATAGHELIVVDNAPQDSPVAEMVDQHRMRYLAEPRRGLNHARNAGLRAARHPIVAYVDDDAAPDPAWADAIARPFAAPTVGCVTGLVMPLELETAAQEQFELYCRHRRSFTRQVFAAPQTPPAAAGVAGMGANVALRRELALRLGGFDPRLDGGTATCSGGDTDMFARVLAAGSQIVYTPDALVWHRHRREMEELHTCIFGYGVGLYSFLTKRLLEAQDLRTLDVGLRWWIGPLVKAAWYKAHGQAAVPISLLLQEAAGAALGPFRFRKEARRTPRLRYVAEVEQG